MDLHGQQVDLLPKCVSVRVLDHEDLFASKFNSSMCKLFKNKALYYIKKLIYEENSLAVWNFSPKFASAYFYHQHRQVVFDSYHLRY
jgi:hypothetical protein